MNGGGGDDGGVSGVGGGGDPDGLGVTILWLCGKTKNLCSFACCLTIPFWFPLNWMNPCQFSSNRMILANLAFDLLILHLFP